MAGSSATMWSVHRSGSTRQSAVSTTSGVMRCEQGRSADAFKAVGGGPGGRGQAHRRGNHPVGHPLPRRPVVFGDEVGLTRPAPQTPRMSVAMSSSTSTAWRKETSLPRSASRSRTACRQPARSTGWQIRVDRNEISGKVRLVPDGQRIGLERPSAGVLSEPGFQAPSRATT